MSAKKIFILSLLIGVGWLLLAIRSTPTRDPLSHPPLQQFFKEVRCVTCPNQALSDSSAPVAIAIREEISRRYQQGESLHAIREYLLTRYGNEVVYRPPTNKYTLALWLSPLLMVGAGVGIWVRIVFFPRLKSS